MARVPTTTMTSADFLASSKTKLDQDIPRYEHFPSSNACGIYYKTIVHLGRCNDVLAYPRFIASYTVSVRQYRILPFGFLHCMGYPNPACHLLTLQGVTPAYKGLSPSGK